MSTGLPYDGYYNGDTAMQMANGTYADFRHMLEAKVKLGKMPQADLDTLDAQWEAIPLDEKVKLRDLVVDETTPKPVTVKTPDGMLTMMKSVPSEGNNVKKIREKAKTPRPMKRALGALTKENNPLSKSSSK